MFSSSWPRIEKMIQLFTKISFFQLAYEAACDALILKNGYDKKLRDDIAIHKDFLWVYNSLKSLLYLSTVPCKFLVYLWFLMWFLPDLTRRVLWGHVITMQPVSVRLSKGHVRSCHHYAACQCQTLKGSCEVMSSLCSLSVSDSQTHIFLNT